MKHIAILILILIFYSCNTSSEKSSKEPDKTDEVEREVSLEIQQDETSLNEINDTLKRIVENEKCNCVWDTVDIKSDWFKSLTTKTTDISKIPQNITEFYSNFVADSLSQSHKVNFNELLGLIAECDTTIRLKPNNWEYIDFDYKKFQDDEKLNMTYYYSEDLFCYEVYLVEIGMMYKFGFEFSESDWKLTLFFLNVC